MSKDELEPGLLQVFRLYAWLQLISFLVIPFSFFFRREHPVPLDDMGLPAVFLGVTALLELGYLYWGTARARLGRGYIPLALLFASGTMIIQQRLFLGRGVALQTYPFLTILLILVAWQYPYRQVVVFTGGVFLLDILLALILPDPLAGRFPFSTAEMERWVAYVFRLANATAFLLVGYVVNRLVLAQRLQRRALAEANQKLVSHAATLEQLATTRERVRLSRELHDTLAHTLSAQAVQLEALLSIGEALPPKVQAILNNMSVNTRSGLDETRRTLTALRASPLEEMGLARALRTCARDFAERHSLRLEMEIDDDPDDLPVEVEQTFYRVAQEALENVERHAQAQAVRVLLKVRGRHLYLLISDDGRGFQPQAAGGADQLGLVGISERAAMIAAELSICSRPGEGTTLRLEWEPPQ